MGEHVSYEGGETADAGREIMTMVITTVDTVMMKTFLLRKIVVSRTHMEVLVTVLIGTAHTEMLMVFLLPHRPAQSLV